MLIKEYCEESRIAVIREDAYGSSLYKFNRLFQKALEDFPYLTETDIAVVRYGGERYAKTFGIEFRTDEPAPENYQRISHLEYTG
jgi:hypothetical protein